MALPCVLWFQVLKHFSENLFNNISLNEFMHAWAVGTQCIIEVKKVRTNNLFSVLHYVLLITSILFLKYGPYFHMLWMWQLNLGHGSAQGASLWYCSYNYLVIDMFSFPFELRILSKKLFYRFHLQILLIMMGFQNQFYWVMRTSNCQRYTPPSPLILSSSFA